MIIALIQCLEKNMFFFCISLVFFTFARVNKNVRNMTAIQMNAELFRELSIIAEDETMMAKVLKYVKKLSAKKQTMDETEYLMSSPAVRPFFSWK